MASCKSVSNWTFSRTFGSYDSLTNISNSVDNIRHRDEYSHWWILLYSHGVQLTRKNIWPRNEWQSGRYCWTERKPLVSSKFDGTEWSFSKSPIVPVVKVDEIRQYSMESVWNDAMATAPTTHLSATRRVAAQPHYQSYSHTNRKYCSISDHMLGMYPT